ncbi:MAG: hypothetical protein ACR2MM_09780 [Flavobacteriaceae bacterium]
MRITFLVSLFLIVIAGCKSQKSNSETADVYGNASSELTLLLSDNYGGAAAEEIQVIRSQGELHKYFLKINMTRKPGLKPPKVDFSKDLVIAYCTGQTTQQELPGLMVSEMPEKGMIIQKKQAEITDGKESTALLMPFGLYIMPITDKEISLQSVQQP